MSKVTSKHQVSIPKALAAQVSVAERLRLFDAATARQAARQRRRRLPRSGNRGWTREDLYRR